MDGSLKVVVVAAGCSETSVSYQTTLYVTENNLFFFLSEVKASNHTTQ
jgi:hypothetical protein